MLNAVTDFDDLEELRKTPSRAEVALGYGGGLQAAIGAIESSQKKARSG